MYRREFRPRWPQTGIAFVLAEIYIFLISLGFPAVLLTFISYLELLEEQHLSRCKDGPGNVLVHLPQITSLHHYA